MNIKIDTIASTIVVLHMINAKKLGQVVENKEGLREEVKKMLEAGRIDELFADLGEDLGLDLAAIRARLLTDYTLAKARIAAAEERRRRRHEKRSASKA